MSTGDTGKELSSLLKKLRSAHADVLEAGPGGGSGGGGGNGGAFIDAEEPILGHFVRAFLLWESTTPKGAAAAKKIEAAVVDFNELRVCMPDELVALIGERYPRAAERAQRLRAALNEIYSREHRVTLEPLLKLSKRDAKEYLDSLEGVPGFVSARVSLICLGGHSAPVDGRILRRLVDADIVGAAAGPDDAAGILERKLRAGELLEAYLLLQAHADELSLSAEVSAAKPGENPARDSSRVATKRKPASKSPLKKKVDAD